ncbi:MAG: hypothetical protein RLZZ28_2316, partial [Bacteroidota bacterium]
MAENTHEEHVDRQTNPQSKDPSEEIISTKGTETIDPNHETESMEVHHHSHSHGKRNWKSYIWEFVMLFLAVFSGFLAEYQLEHKIERERANELAKNFYDELKNDSINMAAKYQGRIKQENALKYLMKYFKDSSVTNVSKTFVINFIYA